MRKNHKGRVEDIRPDEASLDQLAKAKSVKERIGDVDFGHLWKFGNVSVVKVGPVPGEDHEEDGYGAKVRIVTGSTMLRKTIDLDEMTADELMSAIREMSMKKEELL